MLPLLSFLENGDSSFAKFGMEHMRRKSFPPIRSGRVVCKLRKQTGGGMGVKTKQ